MWTTSRTQCGCHAHLAPSLTTPFPSSQVLHAEASALLQRVPAHALEYIPRAENARADALANEAMDRRASRARLFSEGGSGGGT